MITDTDIKKFLAKDIGSGDGSGDGSGYGSGDGSGDGSGYGSGYGYGYGSGYGRKIKTFQGHTVWIIDDTPTIITYIRDNVAKGYILQNDFTLTPCFVVKENNQFAHGDTLKDAYLSLQEKLYDDSTVDERIAKFKEHFRDYSKKYPAKELFAWHHVLTGSCRTGRLSFCYDKGIDLEADSYTIYEFVELTKNSYKGEIIKLLL